MTRVCVVKSCNSTSQAKNVRFFRFPHTYDHQWLVLIQKPFGWSPRPGTSICSLHFRPADIVQNVLRPGAVPFPARELPSKLTTIGKIINCPARYVK